MDDDYTTLLGASPPSTGRAKSSFPVRWLPVVTAVLAAAAVLLSALLFWVTGKISNLPGPNPFKVPTISRYATYPPGSYVFNGAMHLTAVSAGGVVYAVRLAHLQRLQAKTHIATWESKTQSAQRWVDVAAVLGVIFCISTFLLGSIPPEKKYDGILAPQDQAHSVATVLSVLSFLTYGAVQTFAVMWWARGVFLVSYTDRVWWRVKAVSLIYMLVALLAAIIASAVSAKYYPEEVDCDVNWCRNATIQALGEYALYPASCLYIISLMHDLEQVSATILVESLVL